MMLIEFRGPGGCQSRRCWSRDGQAWHSRRYRDRSPPRVCVHQHRPPVPRAGRNTVGSGLIPAPTGYA